MKLYVIFIILLVFIVILYLRAGDRNMIYVISDVDNKLYMVRNNNDKQQAANLLGTINKNINNISEYMYNNLDNTNNSKKQLYNEFKPYILRLKYGIEGIIIKESSEDSKYTSYTINKGEQIIFCIRSKLVDKYINTSSIHDINLIMYVVLHEISHIACPEFGHPPLFKHIFDFFCDEAQDMGIYKKINFKKSPTEYCGMTITG